MAQPDHADVIALLYEELGIRSLEYGQGVRVEAHRTQP